MGLRKTILITIEIKDREFIPKCLLAYELLKRDFRIYIGTFDNIDRLTKKLPSGIFFHKSTYISKSLYYKSIGYSFVFLDEEGGITIPRSKLYDFCAKRYGVVSKEKNDLIFLPGKRYERLVSKLPNINGVKLHTTGWPRIDLCREKYNSIFQNKVNTIRKRYGKYFLVISSFGITSKDTFNARIASSTTEFEKKYRMHKYQYFNYYVELIKSLSKLLNPKEKIILRPHPSESIKDWKNLLSGLKNVLIVRDGDISAWILAADAVIQYGSTATVQAAMNGIPSIQYKISPIEGITDAATFELSYNADTPEQVYKLLKKYTGKKDFAIKAKVTSMLEKEMSFDCNELASSKIANILANVGVDKVDRANFKIVDKIAAWRAYISNLKSYIIGNISCKTEIKRTRLEKISNGICQEEIAWLLRKFSQVENTNIDLKINQPCKDLVCIEAKVK